MEIKPALNITVFSQLCHSQRTISSHTILSPKLEKWFSINGQAKMFRISE